MIETANDIYGRPFEYLRQGKVKGRNTLARMGFSVCQNQDYMKLGDRYFHYNRLKGCWIGEMPVICGERVLVA